MSFIIYIIIKKTKNNKKEYIGGMFATILSTFLLVFFVPYCSIYTINYVFEDSLGVTSEYLVVEKEVRHSGKGGPHYNIHVLATDGEIIDLNVNAIIFENYDIGELIELVLHDGFFGCEYLEFQNNQ